jgi:2,3-bisphosphoglycerate-independent phosphoglycerate mutase
MADHSADHISTAEAKEIVASLATMIEGMGLHLVAGISYRHLLVWTDGPTGCTTHPPHDFLGRSVDARLPSGPGSNLLVRMIVKSWKLLEQHPVNLRRLKRGQRPANSVWPWGQGTPPMILKMEDRFGVTGAVVAAVDLVKGIGEYAGLEAIEVPGATGYLDTNYQGKVEAALDVLKDKDFVFLHVEAPDEAGHSGQRDLKIRAIEDFDEKVACPILDGLKAFERWRILLMPDHQTPVETRMHSAEPVPFILLDSSQWDPQKEVARPFTERAARATGTFVPDASKLIDVLFEKQPL